MRKDKWIPNLAEGKITSHVSYESNVNVSALIIPSKTWNTDKLNNLFLSYEVDAIKRITTTLMPATGV